MNAAADLVATPRAWVGDQPFPWPPTHGLADGAEVVACFAVTAVTHGRSNDSPFLRLQLADTYGTVEGRMWTDSAAERATLRVGAYIGVRGHVERGADGVHVHIDQVAPVYVELDDLILFLPRSARPADVMAAELHALIDSVEDEPLRALLLALLDIDSEIGRAFQLAPAAKQNHHAYLGGLLEHTLSMAHVCDSIAAHYGTTIDRDLLLTGALLHDIGKVREIGARSGFPYTDEGKLLGHILIGLQMITDAAAGIADLSTSRLMLVQHLIASHHGRYEWQSPREPRTLEALVLHYVDDLDAKVHQASALLAAVDQGWTAYDRSLGRELLRHVRQDETAAREGRPGGGGRNPGAFTTSRGDAEPSRTAPRPDLDTLDLFESGA